MKKDHGWKELAGRLKSSFLQEEKPTLEMLSELTQQCDAQNIALAIEELDTEYAIDTFKSLPTDLSYEVMAMMSPDLAKKILKHLEPDQVKSLIRKMEPLDAASVLSDVPKQQQKYILQEKKMRKKVVADVEQRIVYPKNSAGRIMTTQFMQVPEGKTVREALALLRQSDLKEEVPDDIIITKNSVDGDDQPPRMIGVISIRELLSYSDDTLVDDVMEKDIISVNVNDSQMDAAALMSKYRFKTFPVINKENDLVGVIPADELLKVMIGRLRNVYSKAVGTDAQKMAGLTPFQEAKIRVPWLMVTMAIELIAGLVIHKYDAVLQKVILLASFMPVISAISGNVGLQAAAITVRAVDANIPGHRNMFKSVSREFITSVFMAIACGIVLGAVGAIWAKHIPFGLVIGGALICSMLTAGLMGTIIPILSKRLGFDPATTAGPFETSMQDIVGFGVFLWLATTFEHWIT